MSALIGKIIQDRYHFIEFIGRGGMADVYKVWENKCIKSWISLLNDSLNCFRFIWKGFNSEVMFFNSGLDLGIILWS